VEARIMRDFRRESPHLGAGRPERIVTEPSSGGSHRPARLPEHDVNTEAYGSGMRLQKSSVTVFGVVGAALVVVGTYWLMSADEDASPGTFTDSAAAEMGGPILIAIGAFFLVMLLGSWLYARSRRMRAANGVPAMATLVSARDTGTLINNQPRLELELEIRPEGGGLEPYRLTTKRVVGFGSLGSMVPGAMFPISVDPQRPDKFEFIDPAQYAALGGRSGGINGTETVAHMSVDAGDDRIDQLERLTALHRSGALNDSEFAAEKQRLLGS